MADIGKIIGVVVAGLTGCAILLGGGYQLGRDMGAKDYEFVKDFKDQLPVLEANLNKLVGDLGQRTDVFEENKKLNEKAITDAAQIGNLQKKATEEAEQLSAAQSANANLQSQLNKLVPLSAINVTIKAASAKQVIPNGLTVGVQEIYQNNSFIEATVNGFGKTWHVGDNETFDIAGKSCKVELMEIDTPQTNWSISCSDK